jgi:hypothetical protein
MLKAPLFHDGCGRGFVLPGETSVRFANRRTAPKSRLQNILAANRFSGLPPRLRNAVRVRFHGNEDEMVRQVPEPCLADAPPQRSEKLPLPVSRQSEPGAVNGVAVKDGGNESRRKKKHRGCAILKNTSRGLRSKGVRDQKLNTPIRNFSPARTSNELA